MMFSVSDTGIGVKPKDQEIIFEEFRQANGSAGREVEGTGLGLTISKRLVELHDGSIWLESEYGEGTTFCFLLPLTRPPSAEDDTGDGETHVAPRLPVLLVEDDRALNNLLTVYLRKAGYDPIQRYDDGDVPKQARDLSPQLIILEVKLAEKDGWEILRELKSDRETKDIPVALISALEGEKALSLGTGVYVSQHVDEDSLEALVSQLTAGEPTRELTHVLLIDDAEDLIPRLRTMLPDDAYGLIPTRGDRHDGADEERDLRVFALRGKNGTSQGQEQPTEGNGALTPAALVSEIRRFASPER
jgi:CheY-like chemotaxis protein